LLKSTWEFKVRFAETDAAGIVYYPNFYKWMDQATQEMFEAIGFPSRKMLDEGKGTPLIEAFCRFRVPLYVGDRIRVESEITEIRNRAFRVTHTFYRGETLVAEGYEVHAWVEFDNGKLTAVPIPDALRKLMMAEETGAKTV